MCGIVAVFDIKGDSQTLRPQVLELAKKIRHRGPDWLGVFSDDKAILANERLVIVDPTSGFHRYLDESEDRFADKRLMVFAANETETVEDTACDKQAKKVVGIEYVEPAIVDAKLNAELNGIEKTSFYAGDMKDVFTKELVAKEGHPDVVITDPPRAGMHGDVIARLNELIPHRIVDVSCNPATQAHDVLLLSENYEVKRVRPVDMFPHTHHVESVVLLERKAS